MCELVEEYAEKRAKRYAEEREMQVKMRTAKNCTVEELARGRTA